MNAYSSSQPLPVVDSAVNLVHLDSARRVGAGSQLAPIKERSFIRTVLLPNGRGW